MNINLPSNGILGCKSVELALPRYKHLRELSQVNHPEEQIGYEFVKMLLADPSALDRMTYQDKDYLVAVAVSSLHMNNIPLNVACPCGESHRVSYDLQAQELHELPEGTESKVSKVIEGVEYSYHFISATRQQEIAKLARLNGKDEADFRMLYELYAVCETFGFGLEKEGIAEAENLNLTIFYSALLFHEMCFHGVNPFVTTKCPKCQKPIIVTVPFEQSLMNWSSADIMNEFIRVAKHVGGFESFLELTASELEQLRANMNSGAI